MKPIFIPENFIKLEKWDTDLELYSCFDIPLPVGDFPLRPFSIGVMALLETIDSDFIKNPDKADWFDLIRVLYINEHRDKCPGKVWQWIEAGGIENTIDLDNVDSLLPWDLELLIWGSANFPPELYTDKNLNLIYASVGAGFNGFRMIPGTKTKTGILYGAETIGSMIVGASQCLSCDYREILWDVPMAILGHAFAQYTRQNGESISRPPDVKDGRKQMKLAREREERGELHPWQILCPDPTNAPTELQVSVHEGIIQEHCELLELYRTKKYSEYYTIISEKYRELLNNNG